MDSYCSCTVLRNGGSYIKSFNSWNLSESSDISVSTTPIIIGNVKLVLHKWITTFVTTECKLIQIKASPRF